MLAGITRDSVLTTAAEMGLRTDVRPVTVDEAIATIRTGKLTEMFTCGTAAVIAPVGTLVTEDGELQVGTGKLGEITGKLRQQLTGILYGEIADPHGWFVQAWP